MASNDILDAELRREVARNRYAAALARDTIGPTAQQLARRLPRILTEYDFPDLTQKDLNAMTKAVADEFGGAWRGMWDDISAELIRLANIEAEAVAGVYNDYTPDALLVPDREEVEAAARNAVMTLTSDVTESGTWAQFVRRNLDAGTRALAGAIREGYNNGTPLSELIRTIRGVRGDDGVYRGGILNNKTRAQAEALARTGVSHYANVARDSFAEKNKDVIEGRYLFATLDNRTTTICFSRHLNFYKTGEKYPPLPFHHGERSQYIFKTKGFDPLNTTRPVTGGREGEEAAEKFAARKQRLDNRRARQSELRAEGEPAGTTSSKPKYRGRRDLDVFDVKQVSAKMTSDQFLRQQPRWFVESTLGKKKAALFLDGGLKIDRFTDMTGRPLTLDELRETVAGERAFAKVKNDGS